MLKPLGLRNHFHEWADKGFDNDDSIKQPVNKYSMFDSINLDIKKD